MQAAEFHTLHFSFAWRSFGRRLATAFDPSVCVSWKNSTPTVLDESSSSCRLFVPFTSPFFSLSIWSFQLSTARSLVLKRNSKDSRIKASKSFKLLGWSTQLEKLVVLWNLDQLLLKDVLVKLCWIWKTVCFPCGLCFVSFLFIISSFRTCASNSPVTGSLSTQSADRQPVSR